MNEHYEQQDNSNITLTGINPLMNTYAFDKTLVNAKYFKGKYKVDSFQGDMMNIGFIEGNEPDLYSGEFTEWKAFEEVSTVYVVDKYKLFVKGLHVVIFLVQLQRKDDDVQSNIDASQ